MSKETVRRWFFFKRIKLHYHQSFNTDEVYDKICQLHLDGHFSIMVLNNHQHRDDLNPEEWVSYTKGNIIWVNEPFSQWMTPGKLANALEAMVNDGDAMQVLTQTVNKQICRQTSKI